MATQLPQNPTIGQKFFYSGSSVGLTWDGNTWGNIPYTSSYAHDSGYSNAVALQVVSSSVAQYSTYAETCSYAPVSIYSTTSSYVLRSIYSMTSSYAITASYYPTEPTLLSLRLSSQSQSAATPAIANWNLVDRSDISTLTRVGGVITHNGPAQKYRFTYQFSAKTQAVNTTIGEADIWFVYNSLGYTSPFRRCQKAVFGNVPVPTEQGRVMATTSYMMTMNNGDFITCWYYVDKACIVSSKVPGCGIDDDYGCRLTVTLCS